MVVQICLGDILLNALALAAVGIVVFLMWLFFNEQFRRSRRRRERERQAGKS